MFNRLLRYSRPTPPVVLSLLVQAQMPVNERKQGPFELLVRHLLERLLNSESLDAGDEASARVLQVAYALALPGVVVALFLFFPYHPMMGGTRPYWSQASDHFFYVTYAFVVMSLITVLLWDALFPDQLDVFILTSLPIAAKKLLLARVSALVIFLGVALVGTNGLGAIFLPSVAELPGRGFRHIAAHAVSVGLCGLFAIASLIASQGLFICVLGQRVTRRVAPVAQVFLVILLLTTLFLFPLLSHFLKILLESSNVLTRWFPPFWFLGIYEHLLWGASSPAMFRGLARTGLLLTALAVTVALVTYPLAYKRRVKQVIEGTGIHQSREWGGRFFAPLHATLLRSARCRAIYHLIGQTIWRSHRIRLLLAVFAGLGLAMTAAELTLIHVGRGLAALELSQQGVRFAIPIVAFWTVAGLRAALLSPVSLSASWVFRVIHGRAKLDHLNGTERWVTSFTLLITLITLLTLHRIAPSVVHGTKFVMEQAFMAFALSLLLTEIFFLRIKTIPFAEARSYSVNDLPYVVFIYFFLYPTFVLKVVELELWIETSPRHLVLAILAAADIHILLRYLHKRLVAAEEQRLDMEEEALIPGEMGLRN